MEIWESRNHLEFVKESRAWDEGQQPCEKLGFEHRSAEGAGDTTGPAHFEDSASELGTTGRTRARTSCPVQEPRGVSLELDYRTDLSVSTCRGQEKHHRPGKAPGKCKTVRRVQPAKEPTESAASRAPV